MAVEVRHKWSIHTTQVFAPDAVRVLREQLKGRYPYIISDVGEHSWAANCFLESSGLFFASQFPVLNARFEYFKVSKGFDRCASKGFLMIKVI